jgi:hypothetical protein
MYTKRSGRSHGICEKQFCSAFNECPEKLRTDLGRVGKREDRIKRLEVGKVGRWFEDRGARNEERGWGVEKLGR